MKHLTSLSLLLVLTSFCLTADEISSCGCCPDPLPCCPQKEDCIPPRCAQLVGGPRGEITPNAGPCVACGMDLFISADFLYWMIREDHLGYANSTGKELTANPTMGKVFHPDFKMKPGFKVGLGAGYNHDGWDTSLEYTWIRAQNITSHATASSTLRLEDAFWILALGNSTGVGTTPTVLNEAFAKWSLHYFNVIDLELGRNFYVSRYLQLRPHVGFKGSWQKQFFNITYDETSGSQTTPPPAIGDSVTSLMNQSQFFWGVGIRAGLDTSWYFTRSFSLVGNVAISGLWGQFKVDRSNTCHDNTVNVFVHGASAPFHVHNNFHTIKPVIEGFVGLRWETYTCDNAFHFAFDAGWEIQWWSQQNQFFKFNVEGDGGDLNLQGLTIKARFDF